MLYVVIGLFVGLIGNMPGFDGMPKLLLELVERRRDRILPRRHRLGRNCRRRRRHRILPRFRDDPHRSVNGK